MALPSISEYSASINTPKMIKVNKLMGGIPIKKNGRQVKYAGGFCIVFPYETATQKYAVRCWHNNVNNIKHRTQLISETLKSVDLPYFVGFEYFTKGIQTAQGAQDIVVMDWVNAKSLKKYISEKINQPSTLYALANSFKKMVAELHYNHLAHGDLQHGNILVKDNGNIVLVDYDSMFVPALSGFTDDIKGLVGYQHPSRWDNKTVSEKLDYFSELIIYTSLLALAKFPNLWQELNLENTETLVFSASDISSKGNSEIFHYLERDKELHLLSVKIKDYLSKDNIDELEPLEKAIIDNQESIIQNISDKWMDNGYRKAKQSPEHYTNLAENISKNW